MTAANANGGTGGIATASGTLNADGNIVVGAFANADQFDNNLTGHGSNITSGTIGTGGNGNSATATVTGVGTATTAGRSSVNVSANVFGQNGGGVSGSPVGKGGSGGFGSASASGVNAGPDTLNVTANSVGGNGGQGQAPGNSAATDQIPAWALSPEHPPAAEMSRCPPRSSPAAAAQERATLTAATAPMPT